MTIPTTDASGVKDLLDAGKSVVVDFYADWCAPCRAMAPELETLAGAFADEVTVVKVDVDANPEFAQSHGVMSIPTVVRFSADGSVAASSVGAKRAGQLAEALGLGAIGATA